MSSPSFSILINGIPKSFFHGSRGLKQGGPLSPYSFIIVAESFCGLMTKADANGLIESFQTGMRGSSISLIQYADNSLVLLREELDVM